MNSRLPQRPPVQVNELEGLGKVSLQTEKSTNLIVFFSQSDFLEKFDAMSPEERTEGRRHRSRCGRGLINESEVKGCGEKL